MKLKKYLDELKNHFCEIKNDDPRANIGTRDFIATLVFCFSRDKEKCRTLDCIRKFVQTTLCINISRGGFWERVATHKLQDTMRGVVASLLQSFAGGLEITCGLLKVLRVSGILLLDSSSSTLPKAAKKNFPAPIKNVVPASIKLHLCFDLFSGSINWFKLTPAKSHDRKSFPPLQKLIGKLIIFDLGYWDYQLLADIKSIGAFFLTRVKTNAIIQVMTVIRGLPKKRFEGGTLLNRRLPKKKSKIVEVVRRYGTQRTS
ncbi:transposase [Bdellovibrionota bacterium FG-2]